MNLKETCQFPYYFIPQANFLVSSFFPLNILTRKNPLFRTVPFLGILSHFRLNRLISDKLFNFLRYGNYRNKHATVRNCTLEKKIQDLLSEDQGNQLINLDEEVTSLFANNTNGLVVVACVIRSLKREVHYLNLI